MDHKELFVIISRALDVNLKGVPEKYATPISVYAARNHGKNTSHITLEYVGKEHAFYFCCFKFDGTGDRGTGLSAFAMPRHKLTTPQKYVIALAMIEYLISEGVINAQVEYYRDKLTTQFNSSWSALAAYDALKRSVKLDIERHEQGAKARLTLNK